MLIGKTETEIAAGEATPGDEEAPALLDESQNDTDGFDELMKEELGFDVNESAAEPEPEKDTTKEGEPEAEPAEKKEETNDTDEDEKAVKTLPPEMQKSVDRRIGKEVAKTKQAQEALTSTQEDLKETQARVTELETEMADKAEGSADSKLAGHKVFAATTEAELDQREEELWDLEKFCEEHRDGFVGKGTEDEPEYSKERIRTRQIEAREERQRMLPRARELIVKRREADKGAVTVYPDLANERSELSMFKTRLLNSMPGLRMRADASLMIGDLFTGRKARMEKKPAATKKPAAAAKPGAQQPAKATALGKPALRQPSDGKKNINDTFADSGFDEQKLADAWD